MKTLAKRLGFALGFLYLLNFFAFFVVSMSIGGDGVGGKRENGRYYVGDHGKFKEVSRAVWLFSGCHAVSIFVTVPLAILGFLLVMWSQPTQGLDMPPKLKTEDP
jgi:hypothetical protein